jgi:hypothetical protein
MSAAEHHRAARDRLRRAAESKDPDDMVAALGDG